MGEELRWTWAGSVTKESRGYGSTCRSIGFIVNY